MWCRQANYRVKWLTSRLSTIGEKWENDNSQNNNTALNAKPRSMVPFFSFPSSTRSRVFYVAPDLRQSETHWVMCCWLAVVAVYEFKGAGVCKSSFPISCILDLTHGIQLATRKGPSSIDECPLVPVDQIFFKPHRYIVLDLLPRMPIIRMASYLE